MKSIFHIAAMVAVSVFAVSCMKDPLLDDMSWSDDECSLSMDVGFTAFGTALDTRTPGNAVPGDIHSLNVLFYDAAAEESDSKLVYSFQSSTSNSKPDKEGKGTFSFNANSENRTENDRPEGTEKLDENTTHRAKFTLDGIARGRYRIYVVANMPASFDAAKDANTVTTLRNYELNWNSSDIAANNAMFGYFAVGESSEKEVIRKNAQIISVSGPMKMHAWLKRAVSKVTVAFDGTQLNENVWIYIKSVQIKDIPRTCLLGAKNTPENNEDLIKEEIDGVPESARIIYNSDGGAVGQAITTGNPYYPCPTSGQSKEAWKAQVHSSDNPNSLFFFENAQKDATSDAMDMDGSYKPQTDNDKNGIPDDKQTNYGSERKFEIQKDNRPYGTYIEVKAYYVNNNNYEVSRGDIVYRFMLGKNTTTSFDAERSIHYKVTLQFIKNANDVDWHIEIKEDPGIYVPEFYYVSYSYNERTMLPIRIVGNMEGRLKAEIIENSWGGPETEAADLNQYTGEIGFGDDGKVYQLEQNTSRQVTNGVCNGFLQLRKLKSGDEFEIGRNIACKEGVEGTVDIYYNERYWYTNGSTDKDAKYNYNYNLGVREYDNHNFENEDRDNIGEYEVQEKGETMSFNIPLYTRQMKMISTSSYSGANPYYSIEGTREAKIRFTAKVAGEQVEKIVTILQRPRIENPTGIWRAWNNREPFDVTLQYRQNEDENDAMMFLPVESYGPWDAKVTVGSDFITLSTLGIGRQVSSTEIAGNTDTHIKFRVEFNGICQNATTVRCGIITITYHNNSCTHRIFVRQGYAPLAVATGGAKWHSFNLYDSQHETLSPCEEGSMFRPGNLSQPISEENNTKNQFNLSAGSLKLVNGTSVTWDNIKYVSFDTNQMPFGDNISVDGYDKSRLPTWQDFKLFLDRSAIQVAFGVLYADGATDEATTIDAFNYSRETTGRATKGMRGCFIYNTINGNHIFLPIGKSGYGCRNASNGALRYAGASTFLPATRSRPLLYTLYSNQGAIYWSGKKDIATTFPELGEGGLSPNTAFDINYKTFDFNGFGSNQLSGACYIRLVSD